MIRRLIDLLLRRAPERELFLTHTPAGFAPGQVHRGMRITRVDRVADTALDNGGRAPCWRVWGRPITPPPA